LFSIVRKVSDLLSAKERKKALLLLGLIIVMAFLDMIGVASIMPFMAVLAKPELVESNRILAQAYAMLGFSNKNKFMFVLGVAVFVMLILSIAFKAFTMWIMLRFSRLLEYSIAKRFVDLYLRQSYDWYLNRNSADLGKTVLAEVGQVVGGAIIPLMELIAQGCVVTALILLLVLTNPVLACIGGLGMGLLYGLIYAFVRRRLTHYGEQRRVSNRQRFQVLGEVFGGIKDVKVAGLEKQYLDRFEDPAYRFAIAQGQAQTASQLPRYAMEVIAFGGILGVVLFLMHTTGSLQNSLPVLSLYALAGYRLMPAMQALFVNLAALRFGASTLGHLHSELLALEKTPAPMASAQTVSLARCVSLENISYQYPAAPAPTLNSIDLRIDARTTVGLIGTTGSGKTTTVDVILGLLKPQAGQLKVDDTVIDDENRIVWQARIGYVPQHIFLADDSVAANIAFGLPADEIDQAAVERAAKIANLHDFVIGSLPNGYDTSVGERGVRLSGGQRQRIGIARALYRQPQLLILDEATSALDNVTELAVMEAVHNLGRQITIILIAHRLSTVKECDRIYMLDQGRVLATGTYDELLNNNNIFRNMVKAAEDAA
jgi:ABC-type multidrug transport system fused ATPase/permease subunit